MAAVRRPSRRVAIPPAAVRDPSRVQALSRALGLLDTLAETADGMTLADVAQATGLAPSTAHRLSTTLERHPTSTQSPAKGFGRWGAGLRRGPGLSSFARRGDHGPTAHASFDGGERRDR